jgi:hypothetical protein
MGSEFWAAVAGAIVGAMIGGVIAYYLQRQSLDALDAQRRQDKLEHRQTLARSFIVKMSLIYSHAVHLDHHMKQIFARVAQSGNSLELCQVATPIAPLPAAVEISKEELTLLLTLKLDNLFNDAAMMDERHNNLIKLLGHFNEKKFAFNSMFTPVAFTGMVGHIALTDDKLRQARPYMLEINQLLVAMGDQTDSVTKESWALLSSVMAAFNEKLQLGLQVADAYDAQKTS